MINIVGDVKYLLLRLTVAGKLNVREPFWLLFFTFSETLGSFSISGTGRWIWNRKQCLSLLHHRVL